MEDFSSQLPGQLSEKEVEILRMLTHGMTDQADFPGAVRHRSHGKNSYQPDR